MEKRYLALFVVALLLFSFTSSPAIADKIAEYSADQVSINPNGKVQETVKFYVTPEKIRMEPVSTKDKDAPVMIFRQDIDVVWILNAQEKKYLENRLNEEDMAKTLKQIPDKVKEKDLGKEKISGYMCRKKSVEYTTTILGIQRTSKSTVWVAEELDFPLKTESDDGHITELRNIKPGKQSQKLFELPAGYTKMQLFDPMEGAKGGILKGLKLPFGK